MLSVSTRSNEYSWWFMDCFGRKMRKRLSYCGVEANKNLVNDAISRLTQVSKLLASDKITVFAVPKKSIRTSGDWFSTLDCGRVFLSPSKESFYCPSRPATPNLFDVNFHSHIISGRTCRTLKVSTQLVSMSRIFRREHGMLGSFVTQQFF